MKRWRDYQFRNSKDIVLYDSYYSIFDLPPFTVTLRELLISLFIMGLVAILGLKIDGSITNHIADANKKYRHAAEITTPDTFNWGMLTNVGYVFAKGELKAVDTVSVPEIEGNWLRVYEDTERYTKHVKHYTTKSNGHTYHHTRTYYSWDTIDTDEVHSKEVTFLDVKFPYEKFTDYSIDHCDYSETQYENSHLRTTYYCTNIEQSGTIFTELKDNTITNGTKFYRDKNIDETRECLISDGRGWQIAFRVFWILLTLAAGVMFVVIDNDWLSDN